MGTSSVTNPGSSSSNNVSSSSSSILPTVTNLRKNINLGWLNAHTHDADTNTNNNHHLSSLLIPVSYIKDSVESRLPFLSTEIDTLFGGGLTKGSVTLVSGPPGVGKSTLLLQLAILLCRGNRTDETNNKQPYHYFFQQRMIHNNDSSATLSLSSSASSSSAAATIPSTNTPNLVAYISGEEAAGQLRSRTNRLKVDAPGLLVLNETRIENILEQLDTTLQLTKEGINNTTTTSSSSSSLPPLAAVIIDSIQTMFTDSSTSLAGSPAQVRECTARFVSWAKATNVPVILVGHVTKQGDIAGPRVLEHMVDTVMMIEGEESTSSVLESNYSNSSFSHQTHRIIRSIKNRFGSTNEVAILSMTNEGFIESTSSRMFLSHIPEEDTLVSSSYIHHRPNGCSVGVTTEGSRALVVELQALITKSSNPYPRIRSMGVINDRVHMLCAVLNAHAQATLRKLSNQRISMKNSSNSFVSSSASEPPQRITTKVYTALPSYSKLSTENSSPSSSSSAPSRLPPLNMCDILVNVVGGLRISDPTTDAAIVLAIASSYTSIPIPSYSIFIGEVGLGGEIRKCINIENRIKAAKLAGFRIMYIPKNSLKDTKTIIQQGLKIVEVRNVQEMINIALQQSIDELAKNQSSSQNNDENFDEINNYIDQQRSNEYRPRSSSTIMSSLDSSIDDLTDESLMNSSENLSTSSSFTDYKINNNQQIMELLNRIRKRSTKTSFATTDESDTFPPPSIENRSIPYRPMGEDGSDDTLIDDKETDSHDTNETYKNPNPTATSDVPDRGPAGLDSTEDWDITNQEEEEQNQKK